jgi:hypothetical protein
MRLLYTCAYTWLYTCKTGMALPHRVEFPRAPLLGLWVEGSDPWKDENLRAKAMSGSHNPLISNNGPTAHVHVSIRTDQVPKWDLPRPWSTVRFAAANDARDGWRKLTQSAGPWKRQRLHSLNNCISSTNYFAQLLIAQYVCIFYFIAVMFIHTLLPIFARKFVGESKMPNTDSP